MNPVNHIEMLKNINDSTVPCEKYEWNNFKYLLSLYHNKVRKFNNLSYRFN